MTLLLWLLPCLTNAATDVAIVADIEDNQKKIEDVYGWHEVKPGETLSSIALQYYGAEDKWRSVWALNPNVKDPDLINPSTRLRVVTGKRVIEPPPPPPPPVIMEVEAVSAEVKEVSNIVEKSLQRAEWQNAVNGDELEPRDGVRTLEKSSAELRFDDSTALILTEYSQIYLRESVGSNLTVQRNAIELERGQADLIMNSIPDKDSGIEIVIGESISRPAVDMAGQAESRVRREDNGNSAFMVYSGSSEVEASGTIVNVADGMGTRVIPGQPPSKPEKLLTAVAVISPVNLQARGNSMDFTWQPLPGAAHYTLEICADAACARLVNRKTGIVKTAVVLKGFPVGDYYWRVTATSSSGLDGYPGEISRFGLTLPEVKPKINPLTIAIWVFDFILLGLLVYYYRRRKARQS